jgi:hypothetical protein
VGNGGGNWAKIAVRLHDHQQASHSAGGRALMVAEAGRSRRSSNQYQNGLIFIW